LNREGKGGNKLGVVTGHAPEESAVEINTDIVRDRSGCSNECDFGEEELG
jgi:hypothetical protein